MAPGTPARRQIRFGSAIRDGFDLPVCLHNSLTDLAHELETRAIPDALGSRHSE